MMILWLETRDSHWHRFDELQNYRCFASLSGRLPVKATLTNLPDLFLVEA